MQHKDSYGIPSQSFGEDYTIIIFSEKKLKTYNKRLQHPGYYEIRLDTGNTQVELSLQN
jgi:hypothetical protein